MGYATLMIGFILAAIFFISMDLWIFAVFSIVLAAACAMGEDDAHN